MSEEKYWECKDVKAVKHGAYCKSLDCKPPLEVQSKAMSKLPTVRQVLSMHMPIDKDHQRDKEVIVQALQSIVTEIVEEVIGEYEAPDISPSLRQGSKPGYSLRALAINQKLENQRLRAKQVIEERFK